MDETTNTNATEGAQQTQVGTNVGVTDNQSSNEMQLPSSMEELQALLQREGDKRVTNALKKREAELVTKIEAEKAEAAKLAKLSASEREKAKLEKEKLAFESERQAFQREQLKVQTMKEMSTESLPIEFADYVLAEDAEKTSANIKAFKSLWTTALEKAVGERIATPTPKTGTSNSSNSSSIMSVINKNRLRK